jgi:Uma2 family endonuclease
MSTATERDSAIGERRLAFRTTWDDYQDLARILGASGDHVQIAFDGNKVELRMSPGPLHERDLSRLRQLIQAIADARNIPNQEMGATRWDSPNAARGLEADTSFYLAQDKIESVRDLPKDLDRWPIPDLAVEVDHSSPEIDRESIYKSLGVLEVWRFDGVDLEIDVLSQGNYRAAASSPALEVAITDILPLLTDRESSDDGAWRRRVAAWVRSALES